MNKASQTDWEYVDTLQDEDIDLSDIPEITEEQAAQAVLRVGGQEVSRDEVCAMIDQHIEITPGVAGASRASPGVASAAG